MTATVAKIWTQDDLEALGRLDLLALVKNVLPGQTFGRNTQSRTLIARILEAQGDRPAAPGPEEPEHAYAHVVPERLVERLRAYLADPAAASQEESDLLSEWMREAPRDRYEEILAEVRGVTAPSPEPDRAPARDPEEPETGTEIERWDAETGRGASLLPSVSTWAQIQAIAADLHKAVSLPGALRGRPADIALLLLTGRDVGVAPTVALNKIYVIDGRPSMAPELMRALIVDRGHFFRVSTGPTSATVRYRRKEWPETEVGEVTFTLADAQRAGLIQSFTEAGDVTPISKREVWKKYTRAMLSARATSEAGRLDFADVLAGVSYTPEELDADVDAQGAPIRVESTSTTESAPAAPPVDQAAKQAEMDAAAKEAGWESYPAEAEAHKGLAARIAVLTDEQKEQARAMRAEKGWPVRPKPNFDAFGSWVARCEQANKQEAKPAAPGSPVSDAARDALAHAAEKVGKEVRSYGDGRPTETVTSGALNEPEDAEIICPECSMSGATLEAIDHEIGCSKVD